MSEDHFDRLFNTFSNSAFRLETLPKYSIKGSQEEKEFQSYLDGEPYPIDSDQEWLKSLDEWTSQGKNISRLRILPEHPESYINYEIEWGYSYNVKHGEDIFLIEKDDFIDKFDLDIHDFWIFDGEEAIQMLYDEEGSYEGSKLVTNIPDSYKLISKKASEIGVGVKEYLSWKRNNPDTVRLPD
jgi:hypothetical protein